MEQTIPVTVQAEKVHYVIESLLQFLLPHSTWTGLNALIQAQYDWLALHFEDGNAITLKRQVSASYSQMVKEVVVLKHYQRRQLSVGQGLPDLHGNLQIELAFAEKALAQLKGMPLEIGIGLLARVHGAWILSCPEVIIRQAPEFSSSIGTAHTNDDLINLMLEALEFRIILGYGG